MRITRYAPLTIIQVDGVITVLKEGVPIATYTQSESVQLLNENYDLQAVLEICMTAAEHGQVVYDDNKE